MKKLLVSTLMLALAGCGANAIEAEPAATDTLDSEIVNGEVDHAHPSVGKIRMAGQDICTGTLVGSRTVLCAAHCILKPASEYQFVLGTNAYQASSITVHPKWSEQAEHGEGINDLSVILLDAAPGVTPSTIATRVPTVGENLTLVGYGVTTNDGQDYGTKRVTYNSITAVQSTKIYWEPANGVGTTCYGDSGGPAFARVGGEEIQVGITSGGEAPCESGYSWDTRVDLFADWIHTVAKGDVAMQGSPGTTPSGSADTEKPKVYISSPRANTNVTPGKVKVEARVTDNVGVARAELWVDGVKQSTVTASPYEFSTRLVAGTHQLRVYGFDAAGNVGRYTATVIAK